MHNFFYYLHCCKLDKCKNYSNVTELPFLSKVKLYIASVMFLQGMIKFMHSCLFSDLALHKGDIITLLKQIDENWYEGRSNGCQGFLPANYIEVL